jgi:hypothetical protein
MNRYSFLRDYVTSARKLRRLYLAFTKKSLHYCFLYPLLFFAICEAGGKIRLDGVDAEKAAKKTK